jgi:hypothetical protein
VIPNIAWKGDATKHSRHRRQIVGKTPRARVSSSSQNAAGRAGEPAGLCDTRKESLMKCALIVAGLVGMSVFAMGCEEKKADPIANAAKQVGNAAKDAGDKTKDAMSSVADKAKDMGDKAKDAVAGMADKAKAEVKDLMDNAKKKVDALAKGGESLKPDQKGEFDKAMTGIRSTWDDMSKGFDSLKGQAPDAMTKTLADLKDKGTKLMDTVKTTAAKFNINLN